MIHTVKYTVLAVKSLAKPAIKKNFGEWKLHAPAFFCRTIDLGEARKCNYYKCTN